MKIIAFVLFLFPTILIGQTFEKFLAIDYSNKAKRIKYFVNDNIKLKLKNNTIISGTITEIKDSSVVVESTDVVLNDVEAVLHKTSNFVTHAVTILLAGWGTGFILVDTFNNIINEDTIVKKRALVVSGALIGSAVLFNLALKKKYRIRGNKSLKIFDVRPVLN